LAAAVKTMKIKDFTSAFPVLKEKKTLKVFGISLLFFSAIYLFFYGVFTIPVPGFEGVLGFYRMTPLSGFDKFYIGLASLFSAMIISFTFHSARKKNKTTKSASFAGMATGFLGAICPACLGINFLVFGNILTVPLSFLTPYIPYIQSGGLILLAGGVFLTAKNAKDDTCITCSTGSPPASSGSSFGKNTASFAPLLLLIAALLLVYQVFSVSAFSSLSDYASGSLVMAPNGEKIDIAKITEQVVPNEGFEIDATWNGAVKKMIDEGALDPQKLENILAKRYDQEMKPEWRAILNGENSKLRIDKDNGVFMMYVLWALAKHNNNQILFDSPFAKYFKNYDIGVGAVGYGNMDLLPLNPEQQKLAENIGAGAFRPCCNNSTARPDCSHGFSALGLVQLMVSQGFSEEEIFDAFVKFNSYWFPENYVKAAIYLEVAEGKSWNEADKKRIAGQEFSSLSGAYKVKNYLKQNLGI